jgi:glycosyl transferase family 87
VLGLRVLPAEFYGRPSHRVAASVAFLCAFGPAQIALRHGQTTPLVLLVLTLFLAASRSGRGALAGVALAAATLVKIPLLALSALEILRRRWVAAATWLSATLGLVLVSLFAFGPALHRAYVDGLLANAGAVMTGHNNQSIAALLARLAGGAPLFDWTPRPTPRAQRLACAACIGLLGVAVVLASLAAGRRARTTLSGASGPEAARNAFEHAACLALGLVALPVAWDHYFLLLAPALLLLAAALEERGLLRRPIIAALLVVAVLAVAVPTPDAVLEAFESRPDLPGWLAALSLTHYGLGALVIVALSLFALRVASPLAAPGMGRRTA